MACTIMSQTSLQALRTFTRDETHNQQECIPVGCVLPMAVAVCRGGLPQCMLGYSPCVGLETLLWPDPTSPLGVGLENPPRPDPSTSPLGVGLETCKACWDTTQPPGDLQGMLGYHLHCMLGYHPLCEQND